MSSRKRKGRVEFYRDASRQWRWRAKAANGRVVADGGEGYGRLRDAQIGSVRAAEALVMGRRIVLLRIPAGKK